MSEKEKMISGELYNGEDNVLKSERCRAKNICMEYNNLKSSNIKKEKNNKKTA